jgi:large subunit ribosomal protein L9
MRVVLLKDVESLGRAGEVKEVADGFARNFLLPRGLAQKASAGAEKSWQQMQAAQKRRQEAEVQGARDTAAKLSGATITVQAKAGEQKRLYGSITAQDVAEAIKQQTGIAIDRHKLELPQPIKALGAYTIPIKLGHGIEAAISLVVEQEA